MPGGWRGVQNVCTQNKNEALSRLPLTHSHTGNIIVAQICFAVKMRRTTPDAHVQDGQTHIMCTHICSVHDVVVANHSDIGVKLCETKTMCWESGSNRRCHPKTRAPIIQPFWDLTIMHFHLNEMRNEMEAGPMQRL